MHADPSDWLTALGDALREARLEMGLSQMRLGLDTDVHPNYVGGVERGQRNPTVRCIVQLSNKLDVGVPELFARAEELVEKRRA